jgi:hypothetical protein
MNILAEIVWWIFTCGCLYVGVGLMVSYILEVTENYKNKIKGRR